MNTKQEARARYNLKQALKFSVILFVLMLSACGADPTPSPDMLENIQNAVTSSTPEIIKGETHIPVLIAPNGGQITIGIDVATFGNAVVLSDLSDPLKLKGTANDTVITSGRGAIILNGEKIYLFKLSLPDDLYEEQK